jgi:hypothetical protein
MIQRLRIGLWMLALLNAAPLLADETISLTTPWQLEVDDEYYRYLADPIAPPPVRGSYARGQIRAGPTWSVALDATSIRETCGERFRIVWIGAHPPERPEDATAEFWFYRAGPQVLYLQRNWTISTVEDCVASAERITGIARAFVDGEQRNEFYARPEGRFEPRFVSRDNGRSSGKIPTFLLEPPPANGSPPRSRRNRTTRSGQLTASGEVCYDASAAFTFATHCFIERRGPWNGLETYAHFEDDTSVVLGHFELLELREIAQLDGRLFQWDRRIEFREAP